jgi:hypothetical protein
MFDLVSYRRQVDYNTAGLQTLKNANGVSLFQFVAPFSFAKIIAADEQVLLHLFESMTNMQLDCAMSAMEFVIAPEPKERASPDTIGL